MSYESHSLPNPAILKDVQILVVDNDADSRYLYRIVFEAYGARVTTMESIADAMNLLEHLVPDILICEIRFFDEDVLALIKRIKIMALGQGRAIPVLVASAYCLAKFAQGLLIVVEDYLIKPIDVEHLVDKVWNLVHLAKTTETVSIKSWVVKHRDWEKHNTTRVQTQLMCS